MDNANQLIGMKGGLIFVGIFLFVQVFLNLYLKKGERRQKLRDWRRSDAPSARVFRRAVSILIILTIGHMILNVFQALEGVLHFWW